MAGINYLVNPDGSYATRLFPPLLWDARPRKLDLLRDAAPRPEALILGSSRIMNLDPRLVSSATGFVTFNLGVDIAKPEDFYCLLREAVERLHVRPRLVIIAVDVEALHNQTPVDAYLRQPTELGSYLWDRPMLAWRWEQATTLLDATELGLSLDAVLKVARHAATPVEEIDPDGLTHFLDWEAPAFDRRQATEDTIARLAISYDRYTAISAMRMAYLRATLQYAVAAHAGTVVFITPTAAQVEAALAPHGYLSRKREAVAAIRAACKEAGVPFFDFSDPKSFGGDPGHFIDGLHEDGAFFPAIVPRLLRSYRAVQ